MVIASRRGLSVVIRHGPGLKAHELIDIRRDYFIVTAIQVEPYRHRSAPTEIVERQKVGAITAIHGNRYARDAGQNQPCRHVTDGQRNEPINPQPMRRGDAGRGKVEISVLNPRTVEQPIKRIGKTDLPSGFNVLSVWKRQPILPSPGTSGEKDRKSNHPPEQQEQRHQRDNGRAQSEKYR